MNEELHKKIESVRRELQSQLDLLTESSKLPREIETALRERIKQPIFVSATLNFASAAAQTSETLTIAAPGAELNDPVVVGIPNGAVTGTLGGIFVGWVSAAGTVSVKFINPDTTNAINPDSGLFKVAVIKQ